MGFYTANNDSQANKALQNHFAPEFLGRLDEIICFKPLTDNSMEHIASKYLALLQERAKGNKIKLTFPDALPKVIAAKMSGTQGGARQLRRLVQIHVEEPLSSYLLRCDTTPRVVQSTITDNKLCFHSNNQTPGLLPVLKK